MRRSFTWDRFFFPPQNGQFLCGKTGRCYLPPKVWDPCLRHPAVLPLSLPWLKPGGCTDVSSWLFMPLALRLRHPRPRHGAIRL